MAADSGHITRSFHFWRQLAPIGAEWANGSGCLRFRMVRIADVQRLLAYRQKGHGRTRRMGQAGAASVTPSPRRFGEIAYAIEPSTMIDSTLIARSTRVIASASVFGTL